MTGNSNLTVDRQGDGRRAVWAGDGFAQIYMQMLAQSSMLAYKSAFYILALVTAVLSPLVWIMRLPPKRVKLDPEQMGGH